LDVKESANENGEHGNDEDHQYYPIVAVHLALFFRKAEGK
jgi:hypothetical protein